MTKAETLKALRALDESINPLKPYVRDPISDGINSLREIRRNLKDLIRIVKKMAVKIK